MAERQPAAPDITDQIFETHFNALLSSADYARAKHIYDEVGAFNERSLAIQFHSAHELGKLDEVLSAYEKILDPEVGFIHLIPDGIRRAAEIRRFANTVYGAVISDGDMSRMFELRARVEVPKIFDLMGR